MEEQAESMVMPKYYTLLLFGRLLVLAGHRLRLQTTHFQAALRAIINESELVLAPNLMQEQVSLCFYTHDEHYLFLNVRRHVTSSHGYEKHTV